MMRDPQVDGNERSDEAPPVAEPESFGTWLRRQREVREIDLREIADSSKVSMSYLQAFEEDRFEVLPAPIFAKGFLRQYAGYVGLDPEEVINFYLAARRPDDDEESSQSQIEPKPPTRGYLLFVFVATAALVLLVWLLSILSDRAPSATPESTRSPPLPRRETNGMPPVAGAGTGVPAGESALETAPEIRQAEEPRAPLRVTLDFVSDCWVEASVDGTKRLSELKVQGESLLFDAEEVVEIKVGDVGAVQVEVNGIPLEIRSRGGTSVGNVRIDLETAAAAAGTGPRPDGSPDLPFGEGR